jgi:hypothetical protein
MDVEKDERASWASRKTCVESFIMIERWPFFNETKGLLPKVSSLEDACAGGEGGAK